MTHDRRPDVTGPPRLEAHLRLSRAYLDSRNPSAADEFVARVDKRLQELNQFPLMGRIRDDLNPQVRSLLIENHVALYRLDGDDIVVLRIVDGRMDLTQTLDP